MSRILLAWEMGSNLGHVSRLLPLARRLRDRGHSVLVAARDLAVAHEVLGPAGIPIIQAPRASRMPASRSGPNGYAEILWHQGWADTAHLRALIQGWLTVLRLFRPDLAVLDYAPSARLATYIANIPSALIGTGFELPPVSQPLAPFPGLPEAARERVARAEAEVLQSANNVLRGFKRPEWTGLSAVVSAQQRWLTTFAELDHYSRSDVESYVGPIGAWEVGVQAPQMGRSGCSVFAYLRSDTPYLEELFQATGALDASVICYAPMTNPRLLARYQRDRFFVTTKPVRLEQLLPTVDLCVSYAPAGTVTAALLNGVPQLLMPTHVESQLTAHRVVALGAGLTLRGTQSKDSIAAALERVLGTATFKTGAMSFAERYRDYSSSRAADTLSAQIEGLAS